MGAEQTQKLPFFKITGDRTKYLSNTKSKLHCNNLKTEETGKSLSMKKPFPLTSNSEYGWAWPGNKLELYS
jgi:hypothetical protein